MCIIETGMIVQSKTSFMFGLTTQVSWMPRFNSKMFREPLLLFPSTITILFFGKRVLVMIPTGEIEHGGTIWLVPIGPLPLCRTLVQFWKGRVDHGPFNPISVQVNAQVTVQVTIPYAHPPGQRAVWSSQKQSPCVRWIFKNERHFQKSNFMF